MGAYEDDDMTLMAAILLDGLEARRLRPASGDYAQDERAEIVNDRPHGSENPEPDRLVANRGSYPTGYASAGGEGISSSVKPLNENNVSQLERHMGLSPG